MRREEGPLHGFHLPDYSGGTVVNLLASIIRTLGGSSPHPELRTFPREARQTEKLLYLVVDGLGVAQLERHVARGGGERFFARHPHQAISTVFPSTTAAAITSLSTGSTPREHAILGWYLNLPDLGMVSTILLGTTLTGTPMIDGEFDIDAYMKVPCYVDSIPGQRIWLTYDGIDQRPINRALTDWTDVRHHGSLAELARAMIHFAESESPGVAYAYWPRYDALSHLHGAASSESEQHFAEIDEMLGWVVERLRENGTSFVLSADHGFVDVSDENLIELADVPGLRECLATAPSGDARQVNFFVRPHKVEAFERIVERELAHAGQCIRGSELLETGVFGPGRTHAALEQRLGDYVFLARDGHALAYRAPGNHRPHPRGHHGGMTSVEMRVPLYALGPTSRGERNT